MIDERRLYADKGEGYFTSLREDIIALVPGKLNKVLEIGCGVGNTLLRLKELGKASEIVGVDIHNFKTELDNYISGNIEQIEVPYSKEYFDVIICADVIEHLIDPWDTLKRLVLYLKPGGSILASIPNVRELKTLYNLLVKGKFEYSEVGVLDRTHLRFFCKKNIIDLMQQANLKIDCIHSNLGKKRKLLNTLTLGLLKDFLVVQYIIAASKVDQ